MAPNLGAVAPAIKSNTVNTPAGGGCANMYVESTLITVAAV